MATTGGLSAALPYIKKAPKRFPWMLPPHQRPKFLAPRAPPKRWTIVRGDKVAVITGPSKGMRGTVSRVDRKNVKLYLEGVDVPNLDPPRPLPFPSAYSG